MTSAKYVNGTTVLISLELRLKSAASLPFRAFKAWTSKGAVFDELSRPGLFTPDHTRPCE